MTLHLFRSIALCIVAAVVFAIVPGCSSTPDAEETVGSMNAFGVEVAKVKDSIDGTIRALEEFAGTKPDEIQANFAAYSKSVAALDKQANVVRKRADEMKSKGDAFFKEWEAPKDMTPERKTELTASYAKIKESMLTAKEQFTPLLNSLKDLEGYLKLDLSLQGVESASTLVKKAKDNGAQVKASIDTVLGQLNSVRGMLSTKKS
jgi:hypothetical protein